MWLLSADTVLAVLSSIWLPALDVLHQFLHDSHYACSLADAAHVQHINILSCSTRQAPCSLQNSGSNAGADNHALLTDKEVLEKLCIWVC